MSRTLSVALAFIFVIGATVAASMIRGMKEPAARKPIEKVIKQVKGIPVANATLTTKLEITGRLIAKQKVEIFAEVGGTLLPNRNRFKEGNYFKEGEVMLQIDKEEQGYNLLAQKSSLMNQITLMLPDLKSDYPDSFSAWEKYLQEMDVEKELKPLPQPVSDQEKYFISARNLYNLYYTIQSVERRMAKYTIKAPFGGSVASANITEGTVVRVGQKLGDFMNSYTYELEASVNENEIDLLKIGNRVELISENSDKSWKGTVSRISKIVDPATQTIKVFITASGRGLKEGMYLSGTVAGRQIAGSFEIPRNLMDSENRVFLIQDSSLAYRRVEPLHLTTQTAIVKGLNDGDLLLGESVAGAYEGLEVSTY